MLILQDLPFAIIRIIILIFYNQLSKNYTLYFFVIKNIFLAGSEIYLIKIIISEFRKRNKLDKNSNKINNDIDNDNDDNYREATASF